MTEEERYIDYGFEHRVTAVKGMLLKITKVYDYRILSANVPSARPKEVAIFRQRKVVVMER